MKIISKNSVYKKSTITDGVYLNLEIHDINTYYNRFNNSLVLLFGVFQNIDDELIKVENIELIINEENQRTGYVVLPDTENTGDTNMPIEEYFLEHGNLDDVIILDYGVPSVELAKTFFNGGTFENPEIQPSNELAKIWLLNTVNFDGKPIVENFNFE
ncbi:hypothetical protein [Tenacibaculum maritimum]|uniref:hypothetical protein n=1 Tax=Tenacibaculum sp. C7A-26P2 TaxID=3447504 RepID=UPI0023078C33|nr:hypothetical protein [Tenacibaculum maritimum]MDB0602176.1 hypothetical protein [Tenacibaculum maritimum]MDB0613852.1 hypothetical protein [Tenacibaculum maritimum]